VSWPTIGTGLSVSRPQPTAISDPGLWPASSEKIANRGFLAEPGPPTPLLIAGLSALEPLGCGDFRPAVMASSDPAGTSRIQRQTHAQGDGVRPLCPGPAKRSSGQGRGQAALRVIVIGGGAAGWFGARTPCGDLFRVNRWCLRPRVDFGTRPCLEAHPAQEAVNAGAVFNNTQLISPIAARCRFWPSRFSGMPWICRRGCTLLGSCVFWRISCVSVRAHRTTGTDRFSPDPHSSRCGGGSKPVAGRSQQTENQ